MSKRMVISKKVSDAPGRVIKTPLRSVTVHDSFVGIDRWGKPIHSEFMNLAQDLERGEIGLVIDILES